jgi:hypothetical protein
MAALFGLAFGLASLAQWLWLAPLAAAPPWALGLGLPLAALASCALGGVWWGAVARSEADISERLLSATLIIGALVFLALAHLVTGGLPRPGVPTPGPLAAAAAALGFFMWGASPSFLLFLAFPGERGAGRGIFTVYATGLLAASLGLMGVAALASAHPLRLSWIADAAAALALALAIWVRATRRRPRKTSRPPEVIGEIVHSGTAAAAARPAANEDADAGGTADDTGAADANAGGATDDTGAGPGHAGGGAGDAWAEAGHAGDTGTGDGRAPGDPLKAPSAGTYEDEDEDEDTEPTLRFWPARSLGYFTFETGRGQELLLYGRCTLTLKPAAFLGSAAAGGAAALALAAVDPVAGLYPEPWCSVFLIPLALALGAIALGPALASLASPMTSMGLSLFLISLLLAFGPREGGLPAAWARFLAPLIMGGAFWPLATRIAGGGKGFFPLAISVLNLWILAGAAAGAGTALSLAHYLPGAPVEDALSYLALAAALLAAGPSVSWLLTGFLALCAGILYYFS